MSARGEGGSPRRACARARRLHSILRQVADDAPDLLARYCGLTVADVAAPSATVRNDALRLLRSLSEMVDDLEEEVWAAPIGRGERAGGGGHAGAGA